MTVNNCNRRLPSKLRNVTEVSFIALTILGLKDPEEKRTMLISKINEIERQYFEKPSFELKRQIANLRAQLRNLNRQIKKKKSRRGSVEKYYNSTVSRKVENWVVSRTIRVIFMLEQLVIL
jgi:ribosomal protein S21